MQNKIAFITGGSRGLGKNAAIHLAKKGVNTIFTYHSNQAAAEATDQPSEPASDTASAPADAPSEDAQTAASNADTATETDAATATDTTTETDTATAADTATETETAPEAAEAAQDTAEPNMLDALTPEGFNLDTVLEMISGSDVNEIQKTMLRGAIEQAKDNPELLSEALKLVKETLGL